jgi:C4-type Zn-finger protein
MTNIEGTVEQVQNELAELFDEEAGNKKRGEIAALEWLTHDDSHRSGDKWGHHLFLVLSCF